jgi:hypothetical protein
MLPLSLACGALLQVRIDKMTGRELCGRVADLSVRWAKSKRIQAVVKFACSSFRFGIQNAMVRAKSEWVQKGIVLPKREERKRKPIGVAVT